MTQTIFNGNTTPLESVLDQNFTQLYDLRELFSTPSYAAATPKVTFDAGYNLCVAKSVSSWKGLGNPTVGQTSSSIGSLIIVGTGVQDTGLSINVGVGAACLLLLASRNTGPGTLTDAAVYIVRFYFDGNNAPTTIFVGGSTNFLTFGVSGTNTLTITNAGGVNANLTWFVNRG